MTFFEYFFLRSKQKSRLQHKKETAKQAYQADNYSPRGFHTKNENTA